MDDGVKDAAEEERRWSVSRRKFLGIAAGAAVGLPALATGRANSAAWEEFQSSRESSAQLKFWNQPWGNTLFNKLDGQIVSQYNPPSGLPKAQYQVIEWANFLQVYTSAVSSNTGPAVSSGGGTQAFLFEHQGFIQHADELIDSWKSNGLYNDFLPGTLETMKTKQGYAGIPYNLDVRVGWYNPALLQKAGVSKPPTDWQSYLNACAALKKQDMYGFGIAASSAAGAGIQAMLGLMIANGGGLFAENQQPNCVTSANIDAVNFILEMVHKGYVDPACTAYSSADYANQWTDGKFAMGFDTAGNAANVGGTVGPTLQVLSPLVSANKKKGTLLFPNNIMMYKNSPSQKDSRAFLTYYYKNMHQLWTQPTAVGLPVLKSITQLPGFHSQATAAKVVEEYVPVGGTWAAPGGKALFYNVTAVDGTQLITNWGQAVIGGKVTAKESLQTLQSAIKAQISSQS